jgi:hypothetical protein
MTEHSITTDSGETFAIIDTDGDVSVIATSTEE